MKNSALFLFLILIAGLILCSFLGGNCQREGFSEIPTYTGVNSGVSPKISDRSSYLGGQGNVYTGADSRDNKQKPNYDNYNHHDGTSYPTMYYGPNGANAKLVNSNGVYSIIVTDNNGNSVTYSVKTSAGGNPNPNTNTDSNIKKTYYSVSGKKAYLTTTNGKVEIKVEDANGNSIVYNSENPQAKKYTSDNANKDVVHDRGTNYETAYSQKHQDNKPKPSYESTFGGKQNPYSSVLPRGIPRSQIPAGHEDLYILKSEVIPPVCPVCPSSISSTREKPCPPCPPCARCPEPSFECKKVPNYNSISSEYLPQPVLSSFSSFGM